MYNEVLGSLSISPDQEIGVKPTEPENVIGSDSKTTGALYENLNLLVLSTVKALNPKYESAVYMIDPESQVFSLQISNSDSFFKFNSSKQCNDWYTFKRDFGSVSKR